MNKYFILDGDIFIGVFTRSQLRKVMDGEQESVNVVKDSEIDKFFDGVRNFYVKAVDYALKHLPFSEELILNARFVNVERRLEWSLEHVEYFVNR